jgi:hypothetical protein
MFMCIVKIAQLFKMYLEVHSQSIIGYVQEMNILEDEMSTRSSILFPKSLL